MSNTNKGWPTDQEIDKALKIKNPFIKYSPLYKPWQYGFCKAIEYLKSRLQDSAPNIGENPVKDAGDDKVKVDWERLFKASFEGCQNLVSQLRVKDEEIQRLKASEELSHEMIAMYEEKCKALQEKVKELEKELWEYKSTLNK